MLSREHPSELLYLADEAFDHPLAQELPALPDPGGLKVDGVAYTRSQAAAEGWSVVFR